MNRRLSTTVDSLGGGVGCETVWVFISCLSPKGGNVNLRRSSSNSSLVMGVMGRRRSPWLLDFSLLFDGDKSSSKLFVFRPVSGDRVTTVARRLLVGV